MEKKLAELYNKLVNQVVTMIPVEWGEIYYLGSVDKRKAGWFSVFYFTDVEKNERVQSHSIPETYNVSKKVYKDLLRELNGIMLEIYDCFVENGQEPWEELSLFCNNQGKFKVDFLYDVVAKIEGGPGTEETIWAYETFGKVPKEGSFYREILDEYLEGLKKSEGEK